ncbi:MAG: hypothetical protein SV765_10950 [Pseudomonadota bacterium]|nr:hypothetical protein [Pseudomonadales bacterium]MDY6920715.1 hypothetical protein [Pseudomonadota bacterium]
MSGDLLLLADSQLLLRGDSASALRQCVRRWCRRAGSSAYSAAYFGQANGNDPAFAELAQAGLAGLLDAPVQVHWVRDEQQLPAEPCALVLLAGGDVAAGWQFLGRPRVRHWLTRCHARADSLMIGISAGAIHLGRGVNPGRPELGCQTYLGWLPEPVAVHEEEAGWPSLRPAGGLAIVLGGGVWVTAHPHGYQWQAVGRGAQRRGADGVARPLAGV